MELLKIFLITAMITGCAHNFSNSESEAELEPELENIPKFESLVGNGTLEINGIIIETVQTKAWLTVNEYEIIPGWGSCETFMLNSKDELLVKIAYCGEKQEYIMCAGDASECIIDFDTDKSGSSLSLVNDSHGDETRFLVEFYTDKIIYRIQSETCLIGYPHGCIIDGFNWIDSETYTYQF